VSPVAGPMRHHGTWMLMLHGSGFLQYIKTGSDRGDDQFGSINWIMGMAERQAAGGALQFRLMLSVEPATVGPCGYPNLLQTGELCRGAVLHDEQHPHDFFMEAAADYRHAINAGLAFELYGGPAGEPALGPTAFSHRPSALPNPIAPISHHWLDSTHISFGVVTGSIYSRRWKAEASVFNGREPDDQRWDLDLAALDSYSGRLWFLPTSHWSLQLSAGHLTEAEFQPSGPRVDVNRVTASATYQRISSGRVWATTLAWGENREDGTATSAFTAESATDLTNRDTIFTRGEIAGKTASELALPGPSGQTFTIGKLQGGYTRWLGHAHGVRAGVGGSVGVSLVAETLAAVYGSRAAGEFSVFLTIRPQ